MAVINGNSGNDFLTGTPFNDRIYGFYGFDTLQGDRVAVNGLSSSSLSTSTFSEEPSISSFSFIELKQQGEDLLFRKSSDEEYFTFVGHGEYINDPTPLLSSITFIEPSSIDSFFNSHFSGNYEERFQAEENGSEAETDSEITDPLTGLREAEANLIQQIEHLEAGGSLSELGVQGPALETVTTRDLQGALSEIQGYISDELARQEEAALADNFLLPKVLEPGKQVFVVEEGTSIPLDIQEEMMGGEILFMPSEFFEVTTLEDVLTSMGFFEPEGLF